MSIDRELERAKQILADIGKRKGMYDDAFKNFIVTAEELAPYLTEATHEAMIEALRDCPYVPEDYIAKLQRTKNKEEG